MTLRGRASIVGIGQTEYSRDSGRSEHVLALEAILAALEDAGLKASDVDGLVRFSWDSNTELGIAESLGMEGVRFYGEIGYGGPACCATVGHAAAAIALGLANCVVCYRALNERSGVRYGRGERLLETEGDLTFALREDSPGGAYEAPYGLLTYGQLQAMSARRYMHDFSIGEDRMTEILGTVAVSQRRYAQQNPAAMMYGRPMTRRDYEASRLISSPLRLYDFCLETDGAAALVLVSTEVARDLRQPPVAVLGASQELLPVFPSADTLVQPIPAQAADNIFGPAGCRPDDIDVAGIYDSASITVPQALEGYGFCAKGEAGDFIVEGGNTVDSPLPFNTHGGLMSEGYIHGMNTIVECVRQIRGSAINQVRGASLAFVTAVGTSALVLGGAECL